MREPTDEPWLTVVSWAKRLQLLVRSARPIRARLQTVDGDIVYLGEGISLRWLAQLHKASIAERTRIDWPTLRALAGQRQSLVYVEVNRMLRALLPPGAFFTLPWLCFVSDPRRQERRQAIEATFGRKIRQQGFTFRRVHGDEAARAFYRDFYCPYAQWRYGTESHPRGLGEILDTVRHGWVLHVLDRDQVVAAGACRVRDDSMTFLAMGIASDYVNQLRRGVLSALYYEVFRWAREHGMRQVNLMRSRPHARDGVALHKRRFGARPVMDPWPNALLAVYPPVGVPLPEMAKDLFVDNGHGTLVTLAERLQPPP